MLDDAVRRESMAATGASAGLRTARAIPHAATPMLPGRPLTTAVPRWPTEVAARPPRRSHHLSEVEQRAFARFLDLGAALADDFSLDELRRAYRQLAQRIHPDRHGEQGALERAALARRFAEATESYRCLRRLVEPRH